MIPFGLTQVQFESRFRRELDRVEAQTITMLRELLARELNSEVNAANVEIFMDDYGGAPTVWIYFQGKNNKVDHKDDTLFAGRSLELPLLFSALGNFDQRYFVSCEQEEGEFPGLYSAANTMKLWFAECWWKAGGWSYPIPVTLSVHDGIGDGKVIPLSEFT